MKRTILIMMSLISIISIEAQNHILTFDGINDHVVLGANVGNGVRTIEMWFQLEEQIDNTLGNFKALVARETSGNNIDEFSISFQPSFMPHPGTIRFNITEIVGNEYNVYSDNDLWEPKKWYHLAAVVDSTEGMMLFIDGIKQSNTHTYSQSPQNNASNTTLGAWGNVSNRYFLGSMDDVRFSSQALYNSDFTPPCPDAIASNSTIGLWHFNEGSGSIAYDSSGNSYNGQIVGTLWNTAVICQGNALSFDGIDDHVDLGNNVGNGVRTIEMWFQLEEQIDNTLGNFKTLVARETSGNNIDEFSISFQPSFLPHPGTIRFNITEIIGSEYNIFSDNDLWESNKWYHIAAVVDSAEGMMLFIDGIKQSNTHTYSQSPQNNASNTTLGAWGNVSNRYFLGNIDDVRFSSQALYNSDFIPPCPDAIASNSTIGLWHFNEASGSIAYDSSGNSYDGILYGAHRVYEDVCNDSTLNEIPDSYYSSYDYIKVYPNPSQGTFFFELVNPKNTTLNLAIYNSTGMLIKSVNITTPVFSINIENSASGIYFYQLTGNGIIQSGRLLKN